MTSTFTRSIVGGYALCGSCSSSRYSRSTSSIFASSLLLRVSAGPLLHDLDRSTQSRMLEAPNSWSNHTGYWRCSTGSRIGLLGSKSVTIELLAFAKRLLAMLIPPRWPLSMKICVSISVSSSSSTPCASGRRPSLDPGSCSNLPDQVRTA